MAEHIIHFRQKLHNRHLRQHNSQTISPTHPRSYILFLWMLLLNSTYSGLAREVFWVLSSNYYLKVRICQAFIWVTSENLLWIGIWAQRKRASCASAAPGVPFFCVQNPIQKVYMLTQMNACFPATPAAAAHEAHEFAVGKFVGKVGNSWARSEIRGHGRKFVGTVGKFVNSWARVGKVGNSWARSEIRGQGRGIRGQGRQFVGKVGKFVGKVGNSWARSEIRGQRSEGNSWARSGPKPCPRISDLAHQFPTLPTNSPTLPTNFRPCPRIFRPCPRISRPCPRIFRPCPRISLAFKLLCEGEGLGFRDLGFRGLFTSVGSGFQG